MSVEFRMLASEKKSLRVCLPTKRNERIRTYLRTQRTRLQRNGREKGRFIMTEKSWVHYLCFDAYFEDALVKMRSATGLGTTYALFTALNEYFYEKGYIDEKGYLFHRERYSRPLVDEFEKHLEMQDNKTRSEIFRKEQELTELKNQLNNACRNWNRMKDTAKTWYVTKAKTHPELSISKKILMLANERR